MNVHAREDAHDLEAHAAARVVVDGASPAARRHEPLEEAPVTVGEQQRVVRDHGGREHTDVDEQCDADVQAREHDHGDGARPLSQDG